MRYLTAIIVAFLLMITIKARWDVNERDKTINKMKQDTVKLYEKRWNSIKEREDEKKYNDINSSIGKHTIVVGMFTTNAI